MIEEELQMKTLERDITAILEKLEKEGVDCFRDGNTGDIYMIRGTKIVKHIKFNELVKKFTAELRVVSPI
jgi:hypothetical protein